jgi:hypothetical protein
MNRLSKCVCALVLAACATALSSQAPVEDRHHQEVRLPNGKLQKDEILKAEHKQSLQDAVRLSELAQSLQTELEKNDWSVVSVGSIQKTEEISRLAKRIGDRLRHR